MTIECTIMLELIIENQIQLNFHAAEISYFIIIISDFCLMLYFAYSHYMLYSSVNYMRRLIVEAN